MTKVLTIRDFSVFPFRNDAIVIDDDLDYELEMDLVIDEGSLLESDEDTHGGFIIHRISQLAQKCDR